VSGGTAAFARDVIYCKGNQSKAADMLRPESRTLRKKLRQHSSRPRVQ